MLPFPFFLKNNVKLGTWNSHRFICNGIIRQTINSNVAKGTTDPRVEFISQDYSAQFTNLEHITISESRLSITLQNLKQKSAFRLNLKLKSLPNLASDPVLGKPT